jgi:tetrahydromethanopterin S-methyltransferase subunit D
MDRLVWRVLMWLWIKKAKRAYGGPGERGEGFNTACFQSAVKRTTGCAPSGDLAGHWLREAGLTEGSGGCHWFAQSAHNAITDNAAQLAALGRRMEQAKREVTDE